MARKDFKVISELVKQDSRILDLGCGDGALLKLLSKERNGSGYGVDTSIDKIMKSLDNNINVINADINNKLDYFSDDSFDYVILAQSLQVVNNPVDLIKEMLRIGNEVIISFPNMGYWKSRFYLFLKGRMPVQVSCHIAGIRLQIYIYALSKTLNRCAIRITLQLLMR